MTPNEALVVTQADRQFAADWNIECRHCSEYDGDFEADLAIAVAAHRTKAERGGDTTPTCWLYTNSEGHRCVQFEQGLMDLNHWTETPLYASPPATEVAVLREALEKIATVDESGLAEYTPQAMVATAIAALGDAS